MLELSKGTQLARRYTLERPLGRGGEAETWLAKDRMTGSLVALKLVANPGAAAVRLRHEWQTNLRLMHAHIVRAFEFHEDGPVAFYSQQYIDGPDMGALAGASPADILGPVGLLADALRYAHAKGIVHRDIKASNILLDVGGVPYLNDFGVAATVGDSASGGAVIAQSPQSLDAQPAHSADDIFALGGLIYELIAGTSPYSAGATEQDIRQTVPPKLQAASGADLPDAVCDLVAAMLDKDPLARPDAAQVAQRLAAAGFRAAPTHAQISATRPAASAPTEEAVAPVRRASAATQAVPLSAGSPAGEGSNARVVGIALAVLVVVLLGVVFVLPRILTTGPTDVVQETAGGGESMPTEPGGEGVDPAGVAADPDGRSRPRVSRDYQPENVGLGNERIGFNENDADYSGLDDEEKLRFKVDMILGELLSDFETLERRSVQRWAAIPYQRAREAYAAGDDAYLRKNYAAAEASYLDALTVLEPLFDQVEPEFDKALAGARAAFDAGDRAEALRLYELAVAITPNDPEARAGFERARNLDTVLQLVDQGLDYEEDLELDAAERSFEQAATLDPQWTPALEGLERVRQTRIQIEFDTRMSEGLEALAVADYLSARAAFRMAQQLIPGSAEPADGLLQVDQGMRLDNISTLQQEAQALEESEHWDAAATTYEEILKVDANLEFALAGLSEARRMSALHAELDEYIREPDQLSLPSTLDKATMLVVNVTRMRDIGPRLAAQRDDLSRLLKRAVTPVPVQLVSDNMTSVTVYKVGRLGNFTSRQLELRPGTYVAVGIRPGFRDVRLEFRVAPEIDMQPVTVRCEEQI